MSPEHSCLIQSRLPSRPEPGWQEGSQAPAPARRPPGNELFIFRADLGFGPEVMGELGEDKGLGTFGSGDPAAVILSLLHHFLRPLGTHPRG